MTEDEFASMEIDLRSAIVEFKEACDVLGIDASDRLADCIVDAGFSHVEIEE